MSKVKAPIDMFHTIRRKFSWEGFYRLDVIGALVEIGYSNSEAHRLLKSNSIKIKDTKVREGGNHYVWYWRDINKVELVEPEDVIKIGKSYITIKSLPFSPIEILYYKTRGLCWIVKDKIDILAHQ